MGLAERLKYARKRVKLTGLRVRELTGVGASSLSEFEAGKREPSLSQLQALANLYRRSLSFFFEEGAIPTEMVLWRQRPEDAEGTERRFLRLCEQYHNLELWCDERTAIRLPEAQGDPETFGYADAEKLAKQVRSQLELGDRPGEGLLRALEELCGVKVFHLDFEPTGTAAATVSEIFGCGILLNRSNSRGRRNFDLAHELFHLLTWKIFRLAGNESGRTSATQEEKWATCFARNLLMPAEVTRITVDDRVKDNKISLEDLIDIARQFDVSVEALLWQLHFLYGRKPEEKATTEKQIKRAKALAPLFQRREDMKPPVRPIRYQALAVKALRRGEISIGRFAEYLDISRQEAMAYVEREAANGEEVPIALA